MSDLEDVAAAADAVADEQRQVARTVRAMKKARDRGASWSTIVEGDRVGAVVATLRSSVHVLRVASTTLMTVLAAGLTAEGESRRGIARRLGVSHQRITSMLRPNGRMPTSHE